MAKLAMFLCGDSISDRILLLTYMGTPLEKALLFRQRIAAKLIRARMARIIGE